MSLMTVQEQSSKGGGGGCCLGLVVMAVVSTGVILASYRLHRLLLADLKLSIIEEERRWRRNLTASGKKKKMVRFADGDVAAGPSSTPNGRAAAGDGLRPVLRKPSPRPA